MGVRAALLGDGPRGPQTGMYCSQASLVKTAENYSAAKVLKCRSWQCDICRPDRARQLIAQAIKGKANKFITLTVSDATAPEPVERCQKLVACWRRLRAEIAANLSLRPDLRWLDPASIAGRAVAPLLRKAMRDKTTMRRHSVEFLAVVEAQKNGNPHLHIMARCPYVPQSWLSARTAALIAAPVVDIRDVKETRKLANYVAKYCGKDPQRFGTCKRYWSSTRWQLSPKAEKLPWRVGDPIVSRSASSIEDFEAVEHCYGRKVFWSGGWLHSCHWQEEAFADQACEHDGCRFPHHLPRA